MDDNKIYDMDSLTDSTGFESDSNESIIKVIGVGGGGGNAVNYMYSQHIPHVNFVVCNTDAQALKQSDVPTKLLLGEKVTKGRGAGNIPEVGRMCAEASIDEIKKLFDDDTEMVFITAGMGGGTGTGAAPVVAHAAREAKVLTIGIVTVPFLFEGEKKILKAYEGAKEMQKEVDALLVINNENLIELYKDLNFFNAFHKADETLANAARSISEIISDNLYINVDFQDVKTTLKDSGTAIIATAIGEGPNRVSDAIRNALRSPLLKAHDIYTSKRLLFKFMCWRDSPNPLLAEEINAITSFTQQLPKTIDVKWGIGDDPSLGDKVKMTVLASGFDVTLREGEDADTEGAGRKGPIIMHSEADSGESAKPSRKEETTIMASIYGHDKMKEHNRQADKLRYAVLTPEQFDNHEVIALLERTPAYNRATNFNDQLRQLTEGGVPDKPGSTEQSQSTQSNQNKIVF